MSRGKKAVSAFGHIGIFAGLGAVFAEMAEMSAIGWLGGICGGVAAGPAIIVGSGVLGLAIFGGRQIFKK